MGPINRSDWIDFSPRLHKSLQGEPLLAYMRRRRWFREKSRRTEAATILRIHSIGEDLGRVHLLVVTVGVDAADATRYFLPLACACGEEARRVEREYPRRIVADTDCGDVRCIIYDGVYSESFRRGLLLMLLSDTTIPVDAGALIAHRSSFLDESGIRDYSSRVSHVEQSNTSIVYGDRFFFKLFRKVEPGINPDIELTCYLGESAGFDHVPRYAASLTWEWQGTNAALGLLASYVPDARDVWTWVRDQVDRYFDATLRGASCDQEAFLDRVALIGRRTGELHLALAELPTETTSTAGPAAAGPATSGSSSGERAATEDGGAARRAALTRLLEVTMERVRRRLAQDGNDAPLEPLQQALALEEPIQQRVSELIRDTAEPRLIRIHGDYHLGQLLWTGDDLVIIDLEGEPARSLEDRRRRDSVFRDVAGMMRSFHYALSDRYLHRLRERPEEAARLEPLLSDWYRRTSLEFLRAYRRTIEGSGLVPDDGGDALLEVYILEKAIYELGYELDNRPDWISIPIAGIRFVLEQ